MTDDEVMKELLKLEEAYGQEFGDKFNMWIFRFRDYDLADFRVAIEDIIRTRERFPGLATMYKALNDCHAITGERTKPVKPFVFYRDGSNRSYALWNKTGIENDPPEIAYNKAGEECIRGK